MDIDAEIDSILTGSPLIDAGMIRGVLHDMVPWALSSVVLRSPLSQLALAVLS